MNGHKWKIAGICFDHAHMEGLLKMVIEDPAAELVAVCDESLARMEASILALSISRDKVFADYRRCLESTKPDVVIMCPATARHAEWTEKVARFGVHLLIEKPFAATLGDADRMISVVARSGRQLAINWPLRWYPVHATTKRLIDDGTIGQVTEVHYYDGNRGAAFHVPEIAAAGRIPRSEWKDRSWLYRKADGGGSLLDYLGYGATLGTWFFGGRAPIEVTAMVDEQPDLEVDEHSIVVARYATGLSKFETRWGTFTDPWTREPQPKCGFVVVGREGTISSYDYENTVRVQTRAEQETFDVKVDLPTAPNRNPVEYFLACIEGERPVEGPLSPPMARIGQQIVDAARESVRRKRPVRLPS